MDKWVSILLMVLATAFLAPISIDFYESKQCRIEAIKAGVEADKINTACGVK
jgi:hypothetical protein